MTSVSRLAKPDAEQLPAELLELEAAIAQLPEAQRAKLDPLFERVSQNAKRRRKILTLVQDALSQLRLDMKYLMFDLEATRRERDEFQSRLEEQA